MIHIHDHLWDIHNFTNICDVIKQNESEVEKHDFLFIWHFLLEHCLGFNLVKTPHRLTLKELGFLDPSHSRGGGGADSAPPKISKTDWQNIKCVVLVDSYDPPESIGTKKSTNIPCMTSQWHHKWRHVKNTKITKNRQNHGFSLFFSSKSCMFW